MNSSVAVVTPVGKLVITDDVIETVAAHAVLACPGVASLAGRRLSGLLRDKTGRSGVKAHLEGNACWLEIDLQVLYGKPIPEVVEEVTRKVRADVQEQAGVPVQRVEIHVVGVQRRRG